MAIIGVPYALVLGLVTFIFNYIPYIGPFIAGVAAAVVGLFVSIFLWRSGPLGVLELLYTPAAIVIAQFVISLPIVAGFTLASIQQFDPKLRLQILALGASRPQMLGLLLREHLFAWIGGREDGATREHEDDKRKVEVEHGRVQRPQFLVGE